MDVVTFSGKAKRVRIYFDDGLVYQKLSLSMAILDLLRKEGAAGATVFRGIEGFGGAGEMHATRLTDMRIPLPCVIEWIDTAPQVERLLPKVKEMIRNGFITTDDTEVAHYSPAPMRDLTNSLRAGEVMSRNIISVSPETPVRRIVELLIGKNYRAIPVTSLDVPVGIVTNTDLLRRADLSIRLDLFSSLNEQELRTELERLTAGGKTAQDVMTPNPVVVLETTPVSQAAELMAHRHLKRLPVINDRRALVGMISRVDILRTAIRATEDKSTETQLDGLAVDAPVSQTMRREVPTVFLDTPLPEVLQAVVSTRLNRCLVVDHERHVKGVISDAEVLERVTPALRPSTLRALMHRLPFVHPKSEELKIEHHAVAKNAAQLLSPAATVREDALLREAIANMLVGKHKLMAVIDAEDRLVGCLDRADVLRGVLPKEIQNVEVRTPPHTVPIDETGERTKYFFD